MTVEPNEARVRTFIYGSTVGRETFDRLPAHFELLKYVGRQSMISAGNDASGLLHLLNAAKSSLSRRLMREDIKGSLYDALAATAHDIDLLLIDLIDERGGILNLNAGITTKIHEFGPAVTNSDKEASHVAFGTNAHYALWTNAVDRLKSLLDIRALTSKTLVLKTPWAERYENDHPYVPP